ncbi:MAG: hypothetical protein WKH64_03715 [Chloroflexia bacterium]
MLVYPVLGKSFGEALESGELRLVLAENDLALQYYEHVLPLSPASYSAVIGLPQLGLTAQLQDPASVSEMVAIVETLRTAAPEQAELSLERFRAILGSEPVLAAFVEERLAELNGEVGVAESFDQLDALLATQPYRLAFWRVSGEEINYRRFFDINDLAAIRVEREEVFEATHRLLLDLVRRGIGTAVRIDHVDGLYNPEGYLRRLRTALDSASAGLTDSVIPIYVEKILAEGETLPTTWPVAGTSGYDFIADCDGLLVDREERPTSHAPTSASRRPCAGGRLGVQGEATDHGQLVRGRDQRARDATAPHRPPPPTTPRHHTARSTQSYRGRPRHLPDLPHLHQRGRRGRARRRVHRGGR